MIYFSGMEKRPEQMEDKPSYRLRRIVELILDTLAKPEIDAETYMRLARNGVNPRLLYHND